MLPMPPNLAEPNLSQNAQIVLESRYLQKSGDRLETPKELFWRVASVIAKAGEKYNDKAEELAGQFYDLMASRKFLPNSPTLMNAGRKLGQLSACFVLPVGDSIEEIFDAVKYAAMIHKSGGGTGFSFSRLRPRDSSVASTGGVASGPVSFLKIFNTATEQIKQGGTRRGANMAILRVDHPDILEFITAKEEDGEFNNFNFSVGLTEDFMQALIEDANIDLVFSGKVADSMPARKIFDLLVDKAWQSGDPGIVFLDRVNRCNPTPALGEIEATNPCGEQPLLPYEACNLGSINLSAFWDGKDLDWEDLKKTIYLAVRFLDNVVDASHFPLPQISAMVKETRKIGLGVMGYADLLYQMRIPYDSEEALDLAGRIMEFINKEAHAASRQLAMERGPFPAFPDSTYARDSLGPYRNATVTTIAPTGTLSIIAGCSSGIEPLFALSFSRNILNGKQMTEFNPHFEKALKENGLEALMPSIVESGSIQNLADAPESLKRIFVTAMDIKPEWHLKTQAAFQKHTDNAVSKTVNLPNSATREDIASIYMQAWQEVLKGVTVYRDGCKKSQTLSLAKKESAETSVRARPDVIRGYTQKMQTGLGALYLTVNEIDGKPFEVFATIGKSGRSITAKAEAIGRLVSLALRSGIPVRDIVEQLKGIGGEHPVFRGKGLLLSIPDAIAWSLEKNYLQGGAAKEAPDLVNASCPECGAPLVFQEGCLVCQSCGYSRCG